MQVPVGPPVFQQRTRHLAERTWPSTSLCALLQLLPYVSQSYLVSKVVQDVVIWFCSCAPELLLNQLVYAGSMASNLNLTLQLVTADFLPVHTLLHAAAEVWVSAACPQPSS